METSYGSGSTYGIADIYRSSNNNNSDVYRHGGGGTELYRNKSVEYPQKPAVVYRKKSANSGKTIRDYTWINQKFKIYIFIVVQKAFDVTANFY